MMKKRHNIYTFVQPTLLELCMVPFATELGELTIFADCTISETSKARKF